MPIDVVAIDDPDDPRVTDYRHLTDATMRRSLESAADGGLGIFIAEGHLVVSQLLRSGYRPRSFLVTERLLPTLTELLAKAPASPAPVFVAGGAVMAAVAGFDVHRGLLAAADRRPLPALTTVLEGANVVAVLEGLNDHENVGAIFRNAAAFSVNAVVLDGRCCDPLYRRSVRVSLGHVLRVPFTVTDHWPAALDDMHAAGFEVVALTPAAEAEPLAGYRPSGPVALMLGAEGGGLSAAALAAADRLVRIPLAAGVDSLNVATAAAIAFHHVAVVSGAVSLPAATRRRRP